MALVKSALPRLLCSASFAAQQFSRPAGNFAAASGGISVSIAGWAAEPMKGYPAQISSQPLSGSGSTRVPLLPPLRPHQVQQQLPFRGFATVTAATAQSGATSTQKSLKQAQNSVKAAENSMKEADRSVKAAQRSIDDHGAAAAAAADPRPPHGVVGGVKEASSGAELAPSAPNYGVQMHAVKQPLRQPSRHPSGWRHLAA